MKKKGKKKAKRTVVKRRPVFAQPWSTLYAKSSGGKILVWKVWVEADYVCTEYGQLGGALQESRKRAKPKNVGRVNETTAVEQAIKEASAMHKKRMERKYTETVDEQAESVADSRGLPMLAHRLFETDGSLSNAGKKLIYPVGVQPKLNGMRALARWNEEGTKVVLTSREGQPLKLLHIAQQLESTLPRDWELDGEIYLHDYSLQRILSLVKDYRPASFNLRYCVYDVPKSGGASLTWSFRRKVLERFQETASVKRVKSARANSLEDVKGLHTRFVERGFEGAMVRVLTDYYVYGHCSAGLLKVKAFQDGEFEVVDCKEGDGKDEGTATFKCRNDLNDETFDARMKGDINARRAFWEHRDEYIGRMLTVRYFERTPKDIPHLPVGVAFQEDR